MFEAVRAKFVDERIQMNKFVAVGTSRVVIFAATRADENGIAFRVDGRENIISGKELAALVAKYEVVFKASMTNVRAVTSESEFASRMILLTMIAVTVITFQAISANLNEVTAIINDLPSFIAGLIALLAEFAFIGVTIRAVKSFGSFAAARNAQAVSADIKGLEVVKMVMANGNLCIEVRMRPVSVPAKTVAGANVDIVVVAAISLGQPEIGNVFEFGKFALN